MKVFEANEIRLILNLLPKGDVPIGLDPIFYHTLSYEGDVEIHRISGCIREKLMLIL